MHEEDGSLIVVCGEALVDLFVEIGQDGTVSCHPHLAGAPFNLAVGIARLGGSVALCSGLSTDLFGQALRDALVRERVNTNFLEEYDDPTMLVIVSRDRAGHPTYQFPVAFSADRKLTAQDVKTSSRCFGAITFGSYPLVFRETQDHLFELSSLRNAGTVMCLDPNVRLGILDDRIQWRRAFEKFLPRMDIVKASIEDLDQLYPGRPLEDIAAHCLGIGTSLFIATKGKDGATIWSGRNQTLSIEAYKINVIDTVGAGDSFLAAFLMKLQKAELLCKTKLGHISADNLYDAMIYAGKAAAITCSRSGADLPSDKAIESFIA